MGAPQLNWLPEVADWPAKATAFDQSGERNWAALVELARARIDFLRTDKLDRILNRRFGGVAPSEVVGKPIRLAILASATTAHLLSGLRVAALRRGLWLTIYEAEYGQYYQELLDPRGALAEFKPNAILLALDSRHVVAGASSALDTREADALVEDSLAKLAECWRLARENFGCVVLQQTLAPVLMPIMGSNEHRAPGSPARVVARINAALRQAAENGGVHLIALDERMAEDGVRNWSDPVLWNRAKQEVSPAAAPLYGELVMRVLAAQQGRSSKCLVLDLDNTLWGGVIGDDGLEGIELGQGSAQGEAFVAFQDYALQLSRRGVILAVCSKNDESNALAPFERHPEMRLKKGDIACFVANWTDKATNLRMIASELNIGLDSLVFVDDNPFERNLVRRELDMVAVPEVGDDPAFYAQILAAGGYFEALSLTAEDLERNKQYQANRERAALKSQATDLPSYLRSLQMAMIWRKFDKLGLSRIVQLINKTNQFNLTTMRYSEDEVSKLIDNPTAFGLQIRLTDTFGDNGIIAIVIGRRLAERDVEIDTWLMSCRVLGRQVEEATLNLIAREARELGASRLIGKYRPTAKNGMVRDHYSKLGFQVLSTDDDGESSYALDLQSFEPFKPIMEVIEGN